MIKKGKYFFTLLLVFSLLLGQFTGFASIVKATS